jgi:hypothetical protein
LEELSSCHLAPGFVTQYYNGRATHPSPVAKLLQQLFIFVENRTNALTALAGAAQAAPHPRKTIPAKAVERIVGYDAVPLDRLSVAIGDFDCEPAGDSQAGGLNGCGWACPFPLLACAL